MSRTFEPYPCESQKTVMQSLGFQYSTEQRHPHGTSWHGPFDLQINLPDDHPLTLAEASSLVIHSAMITGKKDTQKALRKLLGTA